MVKVINLNANGIRAAQRKNLYPWLAQQNADVICLQEIRIQSHQLNPSFELKGYFSRWLPAQRPGYSGVAIFSKIKPRAVEQGAGIDLLNTEGRWLCFEWDELRVVSLYLPSGSAGVAAQERKDKVMIELNPILHKLATSPKACVIAGDWNIAPQKIDIKNWRANQKNSGFLPHERRWIEQLTDQHKWCDAFRRVDNRAEQYTWWSNRGRAWDNNVGWRIDYQMVNSALAGRVKGASIYKKQRFSDHAPLSIDYQLTIKN